jgi:SAM-dependent methyltransferase
MVFNEYARFYDLLYQDKDYPAECDLLEDLLRRYATQPTHTLLDLGCGTGNHAIPLAQRGYEVTGLDLSPMMLATAETKASEAGVSLRLEQGDLQTFDLGETYDGVLAMFAVLSYQAENAGLDAAFENARRHLKPGGLFIFDAWYGPAVLHVGPSERVKEVISGGLRVLRMVHTDLNILNHTAAVNYHLLCFEGGQLTGEVKETHLMRYLFPQEIVVLLERHGFQLKLICPFGQPECELTWDDWNVMVVAEAI